MVVYETSEEERLIKSTAPLGQGEGHSYWPLVQWLTSTCGHVGLSGHKDAQMVCKHPSSSVVFVCVSSRECFVSSGASFMNKSRKTREKKREKLKEKV